MTTPSQGILVAPGSARAQRNASFRRLIEPYLYLLPAVLLIGLVLLVPLIIGIAYSFQSIQLLRPFNDGWVGLENFQTLWDDAKFWIALRNTVWWTLGSVVLQFGLGLGLALLLNDKFRGKGFVQSLVFLPWAVPAFLVALTWAWLLNPVIGPISHWLFAAGLLSEPYNILGDPQLALWGPIVANVWLGIPFFAITMLAALQSIPGELYEAADIDGATAWQSFTKITLPFLAPMIVITVMLRTIWIATFADLIFVMTGGGPANSTQILSTYIFTTAFRKLDFGYASAIAVALLLILLLYALVLLRVRKALLRVS
ncbi:MAG: sugar ABC transporter permease [Hyphomicrobiales bacterium]|nr:sugar ABC transporter permease [Hyphomicrobiales bacterium]